MSKKYGWLAAIFLMSISVTKAQMTSEKDYAKTGEKNIDNVINEVDRTEAEPSADEAPPAPEPSFRISEDKFEDYHETNWYHTNSTEYIYGSEYNVVKKVQMKYDGYRWRKDSRLMYIHDIEGNHRVYAQNWQLGNWKNKEKYIFSYENNLQTGYTLQEWSSETWKNNFRNLLQYDENNRLVTEINQKWDEASWLNLVKYEYAWDERGNKISRITYDYDREKNKWVKESLDLYKYDINNNLLERTYQDWNGSAWENNFRYLFTYDGMGNQLSFIDQNWMEEAWMNDWKFEFTYDENNNVISRKYFGWTVDGWLNDRQYLFTYNNAGQKLSELWQKWENEEWENDWIRINIYDDHHNKILEIWQDWNNDRWVDERKYESTFDEKGNETAFARYSYKNDEWVNDWRYFYSYESFMPNENKSNQSGKLIEYIFSKSLTDEVNFTFDDTEDQRSELILYDVYGNQIKQMVNEHYTAGKIPRSLNNLSKANTKRLVNKGVYLFEYKTKNNLARGSIVYTE